VLNGTMNISGGEAELDGAVVDPDAVLFAKIDDEYLVCTVEELADGAYENVEMLALIRDEKRNDTILGGFLTMNTAQYAATTDYLFITEDSEETSHGIYAVCVNAQNEKMEVCLDPSGITQVKPGDFYAYETTRNGTYILLELPENTSGELTCDEDGSLYYDNSGKQSLLKLTNYDLIGCRETSFNSKKGAMVTTYMFCEQEEIEELVMDYQEDFQYRFTAYEHNEKSILVCDMEEPIDFLDATMLFGDGSTIDPDAIDAVELLYALDIMKGDGKNFNPGSTVTRAEMAKMVYVMLNYGKDDLAAPYKGASFFSDVQAGAWYEGYVNYCATVKLVWGKEDGTFGPQEPIPCAEAARILLLALGYDADARGYKGASWDKNVLSDAALVGLLEDYKASTTADVQRQWLAKMIENMLTQCYTFKNTGTSAGEEYVLFGEKYYKLTQNSIIWKQVYGQ